MFNLFYTLTKNIGKQNQQKGKKKKNKQNLKKKKKLKFVLILSMVLYGSVFGGFGDGNDRLQNGKLLLRIHV